MTCINVRIGKIDGLVVHALFVEVKWAAQQGHRCHRNPVEPIVRWFYGLYLRSSQQPQELFSYDAVTAFVIAYYRKFGEV